MSESLKKLIYTCGPYEFISPSGEQYVILSGLKAFCETHKLVQPNVIAAAQKKRKTRGWVVRYVEKNENPVNQKN